MYSDAKFETIYKIRNATIREYPYPHFYIESIFPDDFFSTLRKCLPSSDLLKALPDTGRVPAGVYKERFVLLMDADAIANLPESIRQFWSEFSEWLLSEEFMDAVVARFGPYLRHRFDVSKVDLALGREALLVRDHTNYKIGPHTDAPHRLASLLFYLPENADNENLGTSIYLPKDPDFTCEGGPHYPFNKFQRVVTMPYRPNSLFAFLKTDESFHGVEPIIAEGIERDLLLYDIRIKSIQNRAHDRTPSLLERILRRMIRH